MRRWNDYVLASGTDVEVAWAEAAGDHSSVFVLGEGFDPRSLTALRRILPAIASDKLTVISLALAEPGGTSERARAAATHVEALEELRAEFGFSHTRIECPHVHERRSLGRALLAFVLEDPAFPEADHVVVDVSALPTGVCFGVIGGLLDLVDNGSFAGELQVVVGENSEIDGLIRGEGTETPAHIVGFRFDSELDPVTDRPPLVWAPVLGEGARPQLEVLEQRLLPDEICPVLPFPARNPRRADDILLDIRDLIVDRFEVEPNNYIYAHERNPFDLYRTLSALKERYLEALEPLGRAEVVLSIHSSKTLSLGALLAAHEQRMPVMNAEPAHYNYDSAGLSDEILERTEIFCLWLAGRPTM